MFPVNTILAWIINDYHEQGNIIITNLLLPIGHISNRDHTRVSQGTHSGSGTGTTEVGKIAQSV